MMLLIEPSARPSFERQLEEMHRLRSRVFKDRLDWGVEVQDGLETDQFDTAEANYLLCIDGDQEVQGCVRLLPTIGPNMLRDTFSQLLGERTPPSSVSIWESSRFALDATQRTPRTGSLAPATFQMFAGMIEFGLAKTLIDIVTVTDLRIERILRRAGWPLRRISEPTTLGSTTAVAGYLEISLEALAAVRDAGGLRGPVLWQPVVPPSPHPAASLAGASS